MIQKCQASPEQVSPETVVCQPEDKYFKDIPDEDVFVPPSENPLDFWTFSCVVNAIFSSKESILKCLYPHKEF